jgi:micrococcal nuclease
MNDIVRYRRWQGTATGGRRLPVSTGYLFLAAVLVCGVIGYFAQDIGALRLGWGGDFTLCLRHDQQNCVIDGDTIRYDGMTIRLADIDTPETREPKCTGEALLGARATRRLIELMNDGPFSVLEFGLGADRYGRQLRTIERDGQSVGDLLIAEGLARRWDGARHSWCG